MRRTYRALAIVTVVAILVSIISILWSTHTFYAENGYSFSSIGLPTLTLGLPGIDQVTQEFVTIANFWSPATNALAAPIIGTFAIIVAAQARRWGWLVAFIVLGVLCALGPGPAPAYLPSHFVHIGQGTTVLIDSFVYQAVPMILLAIAALIFVASAARGQRQPGTTTDVAPTPQ